MSFILMMNRIYSCYVFLGCLCLFSTGVKAQKKVLSLKRAVEVATQNYGLIKAKNAVLKSSGEQLKQSVNEYLPDLTIGAQQVYGTANGISGPLGNTNGLSVGSSGPNLTSQNWNAAFGSLYVANINWEFFAFGRSKARIKVAEASLSRDSTDLAQEVFQHQVRVAGAYLNLVAAEKLRIIQQNNLKRAQAIQTVVVARAKNGLNAGVDSSLANAEVSNARIALTRSIDREQEQANELCRLMGVISADFIPDTAIISHAPSFGIRSDTSVVNQHPLLQYYRNRIVMSDRQTAYYKSFSYPSFSLFGIFQERGSGFKLNGQQLNTVQTAPDYTNSYWEGIKPLRGNYLVGVNLLWNLTNPFRVKHRVASQKFLSEALQNEYELVDNRLRNEAKLIDTRIENSLSIYNEAPVQVKAANEAFIQKNVLYKNGLGNIVDVTQALFALSRAETDRDIATVNLWQALLLKAANAGNFGIFINEF